MAILIVLEEKKVKLQKSVYVEEIKRIKFHKNNNLRPPDILSYNLKIAFWKKFDIKIK